MKKSENPSKSPTVFKQNCSHSQLTQSFNTSQREDYVICTADHVVLRLVPTGHLRDGGHLRDDGVIEEQQSGQRKSSALSPSSLTPPGAQRSILVLE